MWRSLDPEICTTGKQFVVAFASATKPLRNPGPDTVRQHTGLAREEPGGRGGVDGVAFVPEPDVAQARRLREARQVGDRDADHSVDGVNVVELECIDDQMVPSVRSSRVAPVAVVSRVEECS